MCLVGKLIRMFTTVLYTLKTLHSEKKQGTLELGKILVNNGFNYLQQLYVYCIVPFLLYNSLATRFYADLSKYLSYRKPFKSIFITFYDSFIA